MAKEKRATWWKRFAHQRAAIEAVSDADAGQGLKAAFRYFDGEDVPPENLSTGAFMILCVIRPYIDEAKQDYEKSVENGRKGSSKRWDSPPIDPLSPPIGCLREAEAEAEDIYLRCNSADAERNDAKKEKRSYEHDSLPYKAAVWLSEDIRTKTPQMKPHSESTLQGWANSFRLLNERDGYDWPIIDRVLTWAREDDFWSRNILSGRKFRAQFETLLVQSGVTT